MRRTVVVVMVYVFRRGVKVESGVRRTDVVVIVYVF